MFAYDGVNRYEIVLFSHHKYLFCSFELMLKLFTFILIDPYFKIYLCPQKVADVITSLNKEKQLRSNVHSTMAALKKTQDMY